jgi:hypothetical protein
MFPPLLPRILEILAIRSTCDVDIGKSYNTFKVLTKSRDHQEMKLTLT